MSNRERVHALDHSLLRCRGHIGGRRLHLRLLRRSLWHLRLRWLCWFGLHAWVTTRSKPVDKSEVSWQEVTSCWRRGCERVRS